MQEKTSLIVIYRLSALDGGLHIDVAVRLWRLNAFFPPSLSNGLDLVCVA